MNQGDIYTVTLDPALGREQQGRRPILIISGNRFNQITRLPLVVPITSGGQFARIAGLPVSLDGYGLKTHGVIRCDQARVLSLQDRGGVWVETTPSDVLEQVLGKFVAFLR